MGLILGSVKGMSYDQVFHWCNTAKKTGNHVVLLIMENNDELITSVSSMGVECVKIPISLTNRSPHNERFLLQYLYLNQSDHEYAVMTDVRDVIFQTDPVEWMKNNLNEHDIICSSEGLAYQDEPWGNNNLIQGYPYVYEQFKNNLIYNVGVIGGKTKALSELSLLIYTMCKHNPAYLSDQSSFNILCGMPSMSSRILKANSEMGWALHCGTLGPTKDIEKFKPVLKEPLPKFENNIAYTHEGKMYSILHQYDRL